MARDSEALQWQHLTGMDITCLYTSFWEFICDSGCPAAPHHVGRNYVPLLCGVDTDLRHCVIRDVSVI